LIDLGAVWPSVKEFLNSNFFRALIGSGAGPGVGAWVAQRIVARGREREELLAEIRNTNAATVGALSISNTFLAIKKQHVKPAQRSTRSMALTEGAARWLPTCSIKPTRSTTAPSYRSRWVQSV
jgi:hypothetical protein